MLNQNTFCCIWFWNILYIYWIELITLNTTLEHIKPYIRVSIYWIYCLSLFIVSDITSDFVGAQAPRFSWTCCLSKSPTLRCPRCKATCAFDLFPSCMRAGFNLYLAVDVSIRDVDKGVDCRTLFVPQCASCRNAIEQNTFVLQRAFRSIHDSLYPNLWLLILQLPSKYPQHKKVTAWQLLAPPASGQQLASLRLFVLKDLKAADGQCMNGSWFMVLPIQEHDSWLSHVSLIST